MQHSVLTSFCWSENCFFFFCPCYDNAVPLNLLNSVVPRKAYFFCSVWVQRPFFIIYLFLNRPVYNAQWLHNMWTTGRLNRNPKSICSPEEYWVQVGHVVRESEGNDMQWSQSTAISAIQELLIGLTIFTESRATAVQVCRRRAEPACFIDADTLAQMHS